MPNNILFINKSAKSRNLSRSDGFERSRIFSHVQQLPYRESEEFHVTGWDVSTTVDFDPNTITGLPFRNDVHKSGSRSRHKQRAYQNSPDYDQRCIALIKGPDSPLCTLEVSNLDPFNCGAVSMDAYMADMLKAYCKSILEIFVVNWWAQENLKHHLRYASESPEVLYAMLCSASGAIHAQSADAKHGFYSIQFRGKALHHLRRSIDEVKGGKTPSIATIFAIGFQVYLECLQGDIETARFHYSALENCMSTMVSTENIPLPIQVGIMIPSFFISGMLGVRPIKFEIFEGREEETTDSFLDEVIAKERLDVAVEERIGSGFLKSPNQKLLGPRLCRVVTDIYQIEQIRKLWMEKQRKPDREAMRKLFTTRKNVEYDLLSAPFDPIAFTNEQHVVRLALYLSCQPTFTDFPLSPGVTQSMAADIRSFMEQTTFSPWWSSCYEMLLWVLVVAASVSFGKEQRSWIIEMAAVVKELLNIQSQGEMEDVLAEFYYPRTHFADTLQNLWNDIEAI